MFPPVWSALFISFLPKLYKHMNWWTPHAIFMVAGEGLSGLHSVTQQSSNISINYMYVRDEGLFTLQGVNDVWNMFLNSKP